MMMSSGDTLTPGSSDTLNAAPQWTPAATTGANVVDMWVVGDTTDSNIKRFYHGSCNYKRYRFHLCS